MTRAGTARSILVTGASGVLGSAVAEALHGHHVIRLVRRGAPGSPRGALEGSVGEPRLGVDSFAYAELCRRVDCVVHCAATSHYSVRAPAMHAVNVGGTAQALQLCADADAHLFHVGTALEADKEDVPWEPLQNAASSPFSRAPYLRSKREAERLVRGSGLRTTMLRPSLIIGNRRTGWTPRFQGIHTLMRFILTENYGVVPAITSDRADVLPRDTIAEAIACLVTEPKPPELCWLTAGERAPTMQRMVDIAMDYASEVGLAPVEPRFMEPEVIDRLVRPALLPELPRRERQRFEYVIEFTAGLQSGRIFPTDLGRFADRMDVPTAADIEIALMQSLRFWGAATSVAEVGEPVAPNLN